MKQILWISTVVLVVFCGCKDDDVDKDSTSENYEWKLLRIESLEDGSVITNQDSLVDVLLSITINQVDTVDFDGKTPGNFFDGKFIQLEDNTLELDEFRATGTADTDWGRAFLERIVQVNSYFQHENKLELYTNSEKLLFQKE